MYIFPYYKVIHKSFFTDYQQTDRDLSTDTAVDDVKTIFYFMFHIFNYL